MVPYLDLLISAEVTIINQFSALFAAKISYIIYLYKHDGKLQVSSCRRLNS